ncbi:MAG TPA: enolase C-terminal domain-like protein [Candidatus Paceibacterota bacterium]|nr:enolase C-terminal domain-like protein [Candidatus Paceibacterota bacterium]
MHAARSAFGVRTYTDAGIVRIDTDQGVIGWGEISLVWGRMGSGLTLDVNRILAPALVGLEAHSITQISQMMEKILPGREDSPARAGVEMALIDAITKAANIPAHMVLGGVTQSSVNLSISLHMDEPSLMAEEAATWVQRGFRTLKVKMGRDWEDDRKAIRAVREAAGPDVSIRVDINEGWHSVSVAARRISELRDFDVQLIEQPLPAHDLAGMAELRNRSEIPIAADDAVWSIRDALAVVQARAADIINVYVSEAGGLFPARAIAEIAAASGISTWVGSMPELGIGTAANLHLAASLPSYELAADACGFLYHKGDVISETFEVVSGCINVPTGPGLGVEVDIDAINHYRLDL